MSEHQAKPAPAPAPSTAIQQSDNIAHALSGAGGGILSMVLTYELPRALPIPIPILLPRKPN
jgi:hypothetical protein